MCEILSDKQHREVWTLETQDVSCVEWGGGWGGTISGGALLASLVLVNCGLVGEVTRVL